MTEKKNKLNVTTLKKKLTLFFFNYVKLYIIHYICITTLLYIIYIIDKISNCKMKNNSFSNCLWLEI